MEDSCPAFVAAMRRVLEGSLLVPATIALRGGGFITEVKKRPNVQVVEVAQGNRQTRPGQIAAWVKQCTARANTL